MLSDIVRSWPPRPGPEEVHTGYKQTLMRPDSVFGFTETLDDLHEPAWWTGVKLITTDADAERAVFTLRLMDRYGQPFFHEAPVWDQRANVWTPFPWPIPEAFAALRGLRLRVSRIDSDEPLFMSMRTCFHDMSLMSPLAPYIFLDTEEKPILYWDGLRWGSPQSGSLPRLTYTPIPPFEKLSGWNDTLLMLDRWPGSDLMDVD